MWFIQAVTFAEARDLSMGQKQKGVLGWAVGVSAGLQKLVLRKKEGNASGKGAVSTHGICGVVKIHPEWRSPW